MYPDIFESPIDLSCFKNLSGVADVIYNPLKTKIILEAKKRGIPAEGGLYMLIAQAVKASEIFINTSDPCDKVEEVFENLYRSKENIVLTGMPACGKSTVGKLIAKESGRAFIDVDELIEKKEGRSIPEIFERFGEKYFRDAESKAIKEISSISSCVIATGGGAVLREENVDALKHNGKLYFIDRPLKSLIPTSDRPLSNDKSSIEKRYNERYRIYKETADKIIVADRDAESVKSSIIEDFFK